MNVSEQFYMYGEKSRDGAMYFSPRSLSLNKWRILLKMLNKCPLYDTDSSDSIVILQLYILVIVRNNSKKKNKSFSSPEILQITFVWFRKRYRNEGSPSPRQSPKRRREHSPDSDAYNSGDDKSKQNLCSLFLESDSLATMRQFFYINREWWIKI